MKNKLQRQRIFLFAGLATFIILIFQVAALYDINRGLEADYSSEWPMVQIGLLAIGVFIVFAIWFSWSLRDIMKGDSARN
jgi:hypothetical protein